MRALMLAAAVVLTAGIGHATHTDGPQKAHAAVITEDDALGRWDCHTMGNGRCGGRGLYYAAP